MFSRVVLFWIVFNVVILLYCCFNFVGNSLCIVCCYESSTTYHIYICLLISHLCKASDKYVSLRYSSGPAENRLSSIKIRTSTILMDCLLNGQIKVSKRIINYYFFPWLRLLVQPSIYPQNRFHIEQVLLINILAATCDFQQCGILTSIDS